MTRQSFLDYWEISAALDIGSTFSGYAFAYRDDEQTMYSHTEWGADHGVHFSHKTPTCVLLTKQQQFVAMGFDAIEKQSDLLPEEVSAYKMVNGLDMTKAQVYSDKGSRKIIVMIMKYLKQHMQDQMKKHSSVVPNDKTRWVIPVPADWSEADRANVRTTAEEAGLVKDRDKLVVASQIEAALIFCEQLKDDAFAVNSGAANAKKRLVLDCGGGTFKMSTIGDPIGRVYTTQLPGAAQLDTQFLQLLDNIFGSFTEEFKKRCPGDHQMLLTMFEAAKRYINPDEQSNSTFQIMYQLGSTYNDILGRDLEDGINPRFKQQGVRIWRGKLFIPNSLMRGLFDEVMKPFLKELDEELKKNKRDVPLVLLVGGFGDSALVQRRVQEVAKKNHCSLQVPKDSAGAVLKGAVLYGQRYVPVVAPSKRKLKRSYGLKVRKPYIAGQHRSSLHCKVDDRDYVKDAFDKFVTKDEQMEMGETVAKNYYPVAEKQTKIILVFYSSGTENPDYIDKPKCDVGTSIEMRLQGEGRSRKITITMTFREAGIDVLVEGPNGEVGESSMAVHYY